MRATGRTIGLRLITDLRDILETIIANIGEFPKKSLKRIPIMSRQPTKNRMLKIFDRTGDDSRNPSIIPVQNKKETVAGKNNKYLFPWRRVWTDNGVMTCRQVLFNGVGWPKKTVPGKSLRNRLGAAK
jgi:hypothetical protein